MPITDIERSFDANQPIVVINARTLQRQLIWSELDANPADPRDVTLIVRPAVNFEEGERYIVALRNLRDSTRAHPPGATCVQRARDGKPDPEVEARRAHFEQLFAPSSRPASSARTLYLAWDFTVASREGLSGRALQIRNEAFAELGDNDLSDLGPGGREPQFIPNPDLPDDLPDEAELDGRRDLGDSIRISGNVEVPCFLNAPGCPPGSEFALGPDGLPQRIPGNTTLANVVCVIPKTPARRPAAAVALRPWPARRRGRGHRRERARDGERARLRVLRHRLGRACRRRTCRTCSRCSRTCRASPRSPTAPSRAS